MIHEMRSTSRQSRSFALVVALLLASLLGAAGAGMAMTVCTQTLGASQVALDLRHCLALDSMLVILPRLLHQRGNAGGPDQSEPRFEIAFTGCRVSAELDYSGTRINMRTAEDPKGSLESLARENGLSAEHISVRPALGIEGHRDIGRFLWFDQLIESQEFEEIFRWRFLPRLDGVPKKKSWSDLVTFWAGGANVLYLEIETVIGRDARRWFVVASIDGDAVKELHRGRI